MYQSTKKWKEYTQNVILEVAMQVISPTPPGGNKKAKCRLACANISNQKTIIEALVYN